MASNLTLTSTNSQFAFMFNIYSFNIQKYGNHGGNEPGLNHTLYYNEVIFETKTKKLYTLYSLSVFFYYFFIHFDLCLCNFVFCGCKSCRYYPICINDFLYMIDGHRSKHNHRTNCYRMSLWTRCKKNNSHTRVLYLYKMNIKRWSSVIMVSWRNQIEICAYIPKPQP